MSHRISLLAAVVLTIGTLASSGGEPAALSHAHYAALTSVKGPAAPFESADFAYGQPEGDGRWWHLQIHSAKGGDVTIRGLTSGDPLADGGGPLVFQRYIVRIESTKETLEFRDVHTGRGLLPAWADFRKWFVPSAGRAAGRQNGMPETIALLGHTLTLQYTGQKFNWTAWEDIKRLDLDRELLVGTGRNARDVEGRRLPQKPEQRDYKYVPFKREEYPVMIATGINLYCVSAEQYEWIRGEPVFFHRDPGGERPMNFPADLYRSNYLGPEMFMDEPAIIMVGDKNIHTTLRYFSDAANLLEQRIAASGRETTGRAGFRLAASLTQMEVNLGAMRLEQRDFPAWETMYETAAYQLEAGLVGIVHEERYRLDDFDAAVAKWTDAPRKHSAEEMLRYHYAFLRGAARAHGGYWGTSIYGQAEEKHSPLAVTLAYDMGARYIWFWTSDHDHHMPWPEQLALAQTIKEHAAKHPRSGVSSSKQTLDTAIVVPWGYFVSLENLWWVRALDKDGKNEYSQRFARLMRRVHTEVHAAMDRHEEFDIIPDMGARPAGYRKIVRVGDEP